MKRLYWGFNILNSLNILELALSDDGDGLTLGFPVGEPVLG